MLLPDEVISILRDRGELWESERGLVGIKGEARILLEHIGRALADLAREETDDEWNVPSGLSFETLERAEYFASFPQWLTAASHLSSDENDLRRIAQSRSPASVARGSMKRADAALSPAVCYHTYAHLAGHCLSSPTVMTAEGTCWRHE